MVTSNTVNIMPGLQTIEEIRKIGTLNDPIIMYDFLENLYGPPTALLCVTDVAQLGYIESTLPRDK